MYCVFVGVLQNHFEIRSYILTENVRYRITVNVTDNNGIGRASWKFKTNQIPYGGLCKATNKSGNTTVPYLRLNTGFVPLVEQELLTLEFIPGF
jgi:hypothetical protein